MVFVLPMVASFFEFVNVVLEMLVVLGNILELHLPVIRFL
jgi:hypothetical protein